MRNRSGATQTIALGVGVNYKGQMFDTQCRSLLVKVMTVEETVMKSNASTLFSASDP